MEVHFSGLIVSNISLLSYVNLMKPEIYPNLYSPRLNPLHGSAVRLQHFSLCLYSIKLPSFNEELTFPFSLYAFTHTNIVCVKAFFPLLHQKTNNPTLFGIIAAVCPAQYPTNSYYTFLKNSQKKIAIIFLNNINRHRENT